MILFYRIQLSFGFTFRNHWKLINNSFELNYLVNLISQIHSHWLFEYFSKNIFLFFLSRWKYSRDFLFAFPIQISFCSLQFEIIFKTLFKSSVHLINLDFIHELNQRSRKNNELKYMKWKELLGKRFPTDHPHLLFSKSYMKHDFYEKVLVSL